MEYEILGGEEVKELKGQYTGRFTYVDTEITKNRVDMVSEKVTVSQE